jgi:endonuclease/exonuclease/phosphatase family metal-dependent hydrolase
VARRRKASGGISASDARQATELILRVLNDRQARALLFALVLLAAAAFAGWYAWNRLHAHAPPAVVKTTAPTNATGRVRVATWNLRKFSDRNSPGEHPPDLVAIAQVIRESEFDVLAIQEVQLASGGAAAQKLRRQLNDPWQVEITPPTGDKLKERYAFLYRSDRVEMTSQPTILDGPETPQFDRRPGVASFRSGNFDFTLVTAHLWYGEKANNAKRRQEAAALARFAKDLAARGPERDVIVLGDFNEMRANGNLHLFEEQGWLRINRAPTNLGSTETFDNILFDPKFTREYADSAGVVNFDETKFANDDKRAANDVSDHRPVWADFNTALPDDD